MSSAGCEEEAFFRFFKRWSSAAKAIGESDDHSTDLKERVKKIENDLTDIERSLGKVNTWEKGVKDLFDDLDKKAGDFIEHIQISPSIATAGSSNEPRDNPVTKKLENISRKINKIKGQSQPFQRLPTISPEAYNDEDNTYSITSWEKLESEDEVMDSPAMADARSTYNDLEPQLKLCFLSLSMFPEKKVIRKRSLIYWWIGEGFAGDKEVEQRGEDCFKKLCESGLIEPMYDDQSRSPNSCKLHPWIRWMAIRIAKETMFLDFDSDGKPSSGPSECPRRACVASTGERRAEKVDLGQETSELRSLFNIDVHCLECDEEDFKKLKGLVALQLGRWIKDPEYHIEIVNPTFLDHLGLLQNLRYLGLQGISRITELPESIQELTELRVLDLRACHNLEKLPAGIGSLKKLTHLDVSECYLLEYMPKGLRSLSELQFLDGFVLSNLRSHDACRLTELTKLSKLQKLSISLSGEAITAGGELDGLESFGELHTLTITWGEGEVSPVQENRDSGKPKKSSALKKTGSILDKASKKLTRKATIPPGPTTSSMTSLLLPPKLTKLDLRCFPKQDPPELQNGVSLKKLYFRGGKLNSLIGIQKDGEVSKVETVRLRFLGSFRIRRSEMEEMFPHLKYAEIFKCPHIKTSFLNVEVGDGIRRDGASTSNGSATPRSAVVYRLDKVRFPESSESASKI